MKKLDYQILKISGKDTFFELMSNGFEIGKVQLNFRKWDENAEPGKRTTQQVDFYINVEEAVVLANDILSGRIAQLAKVEKDKGEKFPRAVWTSMGGMNAAKAAAKGRTDGCALSRVLKLSPGNMKPFILTAESGKGEEDARGLIVPRYGTQPENRIMVALTGEQLKQVALLINMHLTAYYASQYSLGNYIKEFEPKN